MNPKLSLKSRRLKYKLWVVYALMFILPVLFLMYFLLLAFFPNLRSVSFSASLVTPSLIIGALALLTMSLAGFFLMTRSIRSVEQVIPIS